MNKIKLTSDNLEVINKVQSLAKDLGLSFEVSSNQANVITPEAWVPRQDKSLHQMEATAIKDSITYHKGNLSQVAKSLKIGRATLYRKLKEYAINPKELKKVA